MTREKMIDKLNEYCANNSHEKCHFCAVRKVQDDGFGCVNFSLRTNDELAKCVEMITIHSFSSDDAVHPKHYQLPGGMQVVDIEQAVFGRAALMEHCLCSATEYILRHKRKNGLEDIKKAKWWIEKYLELAEMEEQK